MIGQIDTTGDPLKGPCDHPEKINITRHPGKRTDEVYQCPVCENIFWVRYPIEEIY